MYSPEEYGDYFAWGETEPKTTYNWGTYKYCNGGRDQLTKYCNDSDYGYNGFTDNLIVLQSGDDAATANWGNGWCMPTKVQWLELYINTTNQWTMQNGLNGWFFTASNGNSLFLPSAGYRRDGELIDAGSFGIYWSSSLYTDLDYPCDACIFDFNSDSGYLDDNDRYYGYSVRPVRSER